MPRRSVLGAMVRSVLPLLIGLAALVVVIAYLAGFFNEKIPGGQSPVRAAERNMPADYALYEVQVRVKPMVEEAIGTLKAASRTEISSRVLAPINRITVRAGDTVEKGQVLVELDKQALQAQVQQSKSALAAAQAALTQAKDEYDRAVKLRQVNRGALAEQEFQQITARLREAEANYSRAEQAVREAEVLLSYATIRAPKSGTIVDRWAEEGDMARPGVPLLSLYDRKSLRLEVPVMENLASRLHVGDRVTVHIDALGRDFQGIVDEKVPQAETATRTFLIKVKLPPADDLYEGSFGRLRIEVETRPHLCLHSGAIQRIGQLEFVRVVDRKTGRVERRFVKTGRRGYGSYVEVLSGLQPGELVIVPKEALKETPGTEAPSPEPASGKPADAPSAGR